LRTDSRRLDAALAGASDEGDGSKRLSSLRSELTDRDSYGATNPLTRHPAIPRAGGHFPL
jgi:hypothetical protein